MTTKTMTGALILALLLGTTAMAGDTARPWAETGDQVGLFNHWSATFENLDAYGYQGKAAEDWGLMSENAFGGLFAWTDVNENGRRLTLRGAGNTRPSEGASGMFALDGGTPGGLRYTASYRSFNHYYDGTTELRYPMTIEPTDLDFRPDLRWARGNVAARYRVNERFALRVSVDEMRRSGEKGSLARSSFGLGAPGVKVFDTTSTRGTVAADWRAGSVNGDLGLTIGKDGGTRDLRGRHAYSDDRVSTSVNGGVAWNGEGLTLLGRFAVGTVEVTPAEGVSISEDIDLKRTHTAGTVAGLWRPSRSLGLTVSARMQKVDTEGETPDSDEVSSLDRERKRMGVRADLTWKAPSRTRVTLGVRYDVNDLLETLVEAGGSGSPAQVTDQERTTSTAKLKARRRLTPDLSAKLELSTSRLEIVQAETGGRYWQGDRKRCRQKGSLGLNYAPRPGVRLDMGGQAIRQKYQRKDIAGVENTFDADRGYATLSWLATDRITVLGNVTYGHEVYDLPEDVVPVDGGADIVYDTTTLRLAPGLVMDLGGGWRMEGHWEAVRNTDSVENDYDRWFAQASYAVSERMTVSGVFRKYEFDENRWDDYILDLYAVTVSAVF